MTDRGESARRTAGWDESLTVLETLLLEKSRMSGAIVVKFNT